jgi:hypothetical protein
MDSVGSIQPRTSAICNESRFDVRLMATCLLDTNMLLYLANSNAPEPGFTILAP